MVSHRFEPIQTKYFWRSAIHFSDLKKTKLLFTCNFILKRTNPVWNAKHRIWLWFKIKIKLFFHWIDTICSDTWTRLTKCKCSENWVLWSSKTVRKRIRYWSETLYVFLRQYRYMLYVYVHMHNIITDRSSCMFENAINECVVYVRLYALLWFS